MFRGQSAADRTRLSRIPPILSVEEPFSGTTMFVCLPTSTCKSDLRLEEFVRMESLPGDLQAAIRCACRRSR